MAKRSIRELSEALTTEQASSSGWHVVCCVFPLERFAVVVHDGPIDFSFALNFEASGQSFQDGSRGWSDSLGEVGSDVRDAK
jgi:hypothetical protein